MAKWKRLERDNDKERVKTGSFYGDIRAISMNGELSGEQKNIYTIYRYTKNILESKDALLYKKIRQELIKTTNKHLKNYDLNLRISIAVFAYYYLSETITAISYNTNIKYSTIESYIEKKNHSDAFGRAIERVALKWRLKRKPIKKR